MFTNPPIKIGEIPTLTNKTSSFPFFGMSVNSTIEDALNKLNEQIGSRIYTETVLTNGQTITASLNALELAVTGTLLTLTNNTPNFIFNGLSTTPPLSNALNQINIEIGNRTYTNTILTNGQTIAASLEALGLYISLPTLTNTGNYFPFSTLPPSPSLTNAVNTLNEEIGNRTYDGPILNNGELITDSLGSLESYLVAPSYTNTENYFPFSNLPVDADILDGLKTLNTQIGSRTYTDPLLTNGQTITASLDTIATNTLTEAKHRALRDLIHFIDSGPTNGFASGSFREILPTNNPFYTSVTWYTSPAKTNKIVRLTLTRNTLHIPTTEIWEMYDSDGSTVILTLTDTITYTNLLFEKDRTRTWV